MEQLCPNHDASITGGPGEPWWCRTAFEWLEGQLQPDHIGLEWGAGSSTPWLARRLAKLTTVEGDMSWAAKVQRVMFKDYFDLLPRWWLCVLPPFPSPGWTSTLKPCLGADGHDYSVYCNLPQLDQTFDFIAIDGRARNGCLRKALTMLRPGGLLLLDNSERPYYDLSIVSFNFEFHDFSNGQWNTTIWRRPLTAAAPAPILKES